MNTREWQKNEPRTHFNISCIKDAEASTSNIINNHPSRFFIPAAVSSSPSKPSTLMSVLRLISSGLSGYTANACVTADIVSSGFFLSLGFGDVYIEIIGGEPSPERVGLASRGPVKRFDILRIFPCVPLGGPETDAGRSPPESFDELITIQIFFQSVWPATRTWTQPSIRPRCNVVGILGAERCISAEGEKITIEGGLTSQVDSYEMCGVYFFQPRFLP